MAEDFFTEKIGLEPETDFENDMRIVIKNGSPNMIDEIKAIRQWITKFALTPKDVYPIYQGSGFGTRIKELYGKKRIGYGFEEAEIQRDFEEGLPLCPAISRISSFKLSKKGKVLSIKMEVELYNGEKLDVDLEKIYTISI